MVVKDTTKLYTYWRKSVCTDNSTCKNWVRLSD